MITNKKVKGFLLAMLGALFWGIQGPISQFLFQDTNVSTEWLMGVKMMISGLILISLTIAKDGVVNFLAPLKNRKDRWQLLAYSFIGITLVQYMYFLTIKVSDAGIATILQSLGTIIIILLSIIFYKKWPNRNEIIAVILAIMGTWLLVTKPDSLLIINLSAKTLIFGFLLAFAGAIQTMLPVSLLKKYSSLTLVGYAMLLGGLVFQIINPFWHNYPPFSWTVYLGVGFIVFFGTALAYLCFTTSLHYISATSAGLLSAVEPASAVIGTIYFLHTTFTWNQVVGGLLVLSTIFVLALPNKSKKEV